MFGRLLAGVDTVGHADATEAAALGVTGTPGFFINGLFLSGARPFDSFKTVIDKELKAG